jgi:hypothetical protein
MFFFCSTNNYYHIRHSCLEHRIILPTKNMSNSIHVSIIFITPVERIWKFDLDKNYLYWFNLLLNTRKKITNRKKNKPKKYEKNVNQTTENLDQVNIWDETPKVTITDKIIIYNVPKINLSASKLTFILICWKATRE